MTLTWRKPRLSGSFRRQTSVECETCTPDVSAHFIFDSVAPLALVGGGGQTPVFSFKTIPNNPPPNDLLNLNDSLEKIKNFTKKHFLIFFNLHFKLDIFIEKKNRSYPAQ